MATSRERAQIPSDLRFVAYDATMPPVVFAPNGALSLYNRGGGGGSRPKLTCRIFSATESAD
jgi:hypothetical protein